LKFHHVSHKEIFFIDVNRLILTCEHLGRGHLNPRISSFCDKRHVDQKMHELLLMIILSCWDYADVPPVTCYRRHWRG